MFSEFGPILNCCHRMDDARINLRLIRFYFRHSFVTEYSLKSHVRNVHERTPRDELVCHICAKVYHTSGGMKNHLQKHNGIEEPRLNCDICGNSLKNKKSLQKHMTMHKDEGKSYPCPTCHKISPTRYALANHIKAVHNYKTHKCHLCDKECKSVVALKVGIIFAACAFCSEVND